MSPLPPPAPEHAGQVGAGRLRRRRRAAGARPAAPRRDAPTAGRGRPADRLAISPHGGTVLIADVGARGAHLAVGDELLAGAMVLGIEQVLSADAIGDLADR